MWERAISIGRRLCLQARYEARPRHSDGRQSPCFKGETSPLRSPLLEEPKRRKTGTQVVDCFSVGTIGEGQRAAAPIFSVFNISSAETLYFQALQRVKRILFDMKNPQTGEPITGRRTRRSCLRSGNQSGADPEPIRSRTTRATL